MSPLQPVIVVLTDGEANLACYVDHLKREGLRVLVTARPYELALFMTRHPVTGLVLRRELIGDPPEDMLRPLKELAPDALLLVTGGPDALSGEARTLMDHYLVEPFRYSALLELLDYARARQEDRRRRVTSDGPALQQGEAEDAEPPAPDRPARLLECARKLTELERDRESLLTAGLAMFLEVADCERASLMLRDEEEGRLRIARKSGFPPGDSELEPGARPSPAERVAESGIPMLVEEAREENRPGYRAPSFMIVPLMDRRTVIGVVNLSEPRGGAPFGREKLDTLTWLARQFAVNLVNAVRLEDLQHMTVVDPLTGLFNRRFFDRQIAVELERARRTGREVTLALLDIDKFKLINDFNGYVTGDAVLEGVATAIRANVREIDVVTRWGGDEFALLLPETASKAGRKAASRAVERVRRAVDTEEFRTSLPSMAGRVTLSAGLASFPSDADDRSGLFALANAALKRAKGAGGNCACIHGGDRAETGAAELEAGM